MYLSRLTVIAAVFATLLSGVVQAQTAYVANAGAQTISMINMSTNTISKTVAQSGAPSGVGMTPDGLWVYVACASGNSVAVMSTATGTMVATIPVGTYPVRVAVTPNGAEVYVMNQNSKNVSVINVASRSVVATIPVGSAPTGAAFSPDGTRAYITNNYTANVSVIDTGSHSVVSTFATATGPSGIAVLPNGNIYISNQYSNVVSVHNSTGALLTQISGFVYPNWLAKNPTGSRVYVTNGNSNTLAVIDTASNSIVANITLPYANPVSVTVSTDGSLAYVVLESASEIAVIATGTNTVKTVISPIGPYPFDVAVLPAAAIVGTGGTTPTCSFSLASSSMSMPSGGGTGSVMLNASSSSCGWTASSDAGWLTLTSPLSGSGGMNVTFSATSNLSSARTGHITAGGQTYTVNQAGAATTFTPIRVRCGGPQLTDSAGHVWVSDNASNYSVTNASIGNASPLMALYQTEAWSTGTLQYQYSVANGSRTVVLKFAESYMTASGQRQFNIVVNGTTYYASFDILGHTSPNTAYDVSIPVGVSNGQITIQLQSVKGPAKINAIEID